MINAPTFTNILRQSYVSGNKGNPLCLSVQDSVLLILKMYIYVYWVIERMDGIWNRYNLKSTGRIYTFGILKYSEVFKVLDLH